jgi:hypothetical protein
MTPAIAFPNRAKNLLAGAFSLIALGALWLYLITPVSGEASSDVDYSRSRNPILSGLVENGGDRPASGAVIVVRFASLQGGRVWVPASALKTGRWFYQEKKKKRPEAKLQVSKGGRWALKIPPRARKARIIIRKTRLSDAPVTALSVRIPPGESVAITTEFPPRNPPIIPGPIPY